ncbi:hypothetical protein [Enterobacter kobei]|uniref:hypothetical protein n=1 Tax=Enterobacter kobei TaxID=208224 RepID=UPI002FD64567
MLHEIYTASWANIWAAMSAISTTLTVIVAWRAMLRWRKQDELKVKMAFKQAVADYSYCLMHLPTQLQSPVRRVEYMDKCKELVDRLSVCHNAWLLTEGLMAKETDIVEAWEFIFTNHKNYLSGALSSLVLGAHCTTILNKRFVFK